MTPHPVSGAAQQLLVAVQEPQKQNTCLLSGAVERRKVAAGNLLILWATRPA
jgi:hypothetical protein